METNIQQVLSQQYKPLTPAEVLASYDHIPLTERECIEAMIIAKQKKERSLKDQELRQREEDNRQFMLSQWSVTQTRQYMNKRAGELFNGEFKVDDSNQRIFDLLCLYFSEDPKFELEAQKDGITGASLSKGILIAGTYGTGKTWLMKLFGKNRRQVYHVHNAKDIANSFSKNGEVEEFTQPFQNPMDDKVSFYHPISGLCIDDMGAEDLKNHFGNKTNVIGDVIELRYANKCTGKLLHATTNLNGEGIKEFYGLRVASRMREIFNIIELPGDDRRK